MPVKRKTEIFTFLLTVCLFFSSHVFAQNQKITIDKIEITDNILTTTYFIDSLFSQKIITGLDRGLTVSIEYNIELWKKRPNWFDTSIQLCETWAKVAFFKLENRYIYQTPNEKRRISSFQKVYGNLSKIIQYPIIGAEKLQRNKTYYFIISIKLKPLSNEDISEISAWLDGGENEKSGMDSTAASKNRITNQLMKMVVNFTGMGEKQFSAQSPNFTVDGDNVIITGDK